MESLRASWEVRAGLIPGQPDQKHTRQFHLTSSEWNSENGLKFLVSRASEAQAHATFLMLSCSQGYEVNWTEVTFIWY